MNTLKNIKLIIIPILLGISLWGCSSGNDSQQEKVTQQKEKQPKEKQPKKLANFSIHIRPNCLIASCPEVSITQDSLIWGNQSEKASVLKKALPQSEAQSFEKLLRSSGLLQAKSSYINGYYDDGIQVTFKLKLAGKNHQIYISNYYHTQVAQLVEAVNRLLEKQDVTDENLKLIAYPEKMLKEFTAKGEKSNSIEIK